MSRPTGTCKGCGFYVFMDMDVEAARLGYCGLCTEGRQAVWAAFTARRACRAFARGLFGVCIALARDSVNSGPTQFQNERTAAWDEAHYEWYWDFFYWALRELAPWAPVET